MNFFLNLIQTEFFQSKYRVTGSGIVNAAQRFAGVLTPMIGTVLIHQVCSFFLFFENNPEF